MEMILGQLKYFGASFLWGVILMFGYDFILIFRRKVRHGAFWRTVEDWLFWAVAALLVFQMIFALNNGIIRSFFVASFAGGMFLYRKLMKEHFVSAVVAVLDFIFRPYVWISRKIRKICEKKRKNSEKSLKNPCNSEEKPL